jgi:hypothetical protein
MEQPDLNNVSRGAEVSQELQEFGSCRSQEPRNGRSLLACGDGLSVAALAAYSIRRNSVRSILCFHP